MKKLLITTDEMKAIHRAVFLYDGEVAHDFYTAAMTPPISRFDGLNRHYALACVFTAGRFQGVREERAKRKKKIERRRARSEQQPERGNA